MGNDYAQKIKEVKEEEVIEVDKKAILKEQQARRKRDIEA